MLSRETIELLEQSLTKILNLPDNGKGIYLEVSIHNTPDNYMDTVLEGSDLEFQSPVYVDCIASDTSWVCKARGTIQCGNANNDMKVVFYPKWKE